MAAEHTKDFTRDNSSKALLSADTKDLERHKKQKAAMKEIKDLRTAVGRINKLEETVSFLLNEVEQLKKQVT